MISSGHGSRDEDVCEWHERKDWSPYIRQTNSSFFGAWESGATSRSIAMEIAPEATACDRNMSVQSAAHINMARLKELRSTVGEKCSTGWIDNLSHSVQLPGFCLNSALLTRTPFMA